MTKNTAIGSLHHSHPRSDGTYFYRNCEGGCFKYILRDGEKKICSQVSCGEFSVTYFSSRFGGYAVPESNGLPLDSRATQDCTLYKGNPLDRAALLAVDEQRNLYILAHGKVTSITGETVSAVLVKKFSQP
jgi:hypothetical protein